MMGVKGVNAIVLAGGKSRRMGRDKASLPLGEKTLIDCLLDLLKELFDRIIVVGARPGVVMDASVFCVADEKPGIGPLMGICSGLEASDTECNFVTACDIPEFDKTFLKRMLERAGEYDILVPRHPDGRHEPLFAVYKRRLLPLIRFCLDEGVTKIDRIYPLCRQGYIEIGDESMLTNINTPQEYSEYLGRLNKEGMV